MLSQLHRNYGTLVFSFPNMPLDHFRDNFCQQRKRIAQKTSTPRILKIHFHTFRHWKATMLYHEKPDAIMVKQFLGHKSIKSTELRINIERTIFDPSSDEFIVKITEKPEKVKALLEVGFEYVCQKDGLIFLRKRK